MKKKMIAALSMVLAICLIAAGCSKDKNLNDNGGEVAAIADNESEGIGDTEKTDGGQQSVSNQKTESMIVPEITTEIDNPAAHLFTGEPDDYNDITPVFEGLGSVVQVYTVAPDILAIYMEDGYVSDSVVSEYISQDGDKISQSGGGAGHVTKTLLRQGKIVGTLTDGEKLLTVPGKFIGAKTEAEILKQTGNYTIYSHTDSAYSEYIHPKEVWVKTKPAAYLWDSYSHMNVTTVYLKLEKPLKEGCSYYVVTEGLQLHNPAGRFTYISGLRRTEAIHTNQVGYRPDDPIKCAFLSVWLGDGGSMTYDKEAPFYLIDSSGKQVYEGKPVLVKGVKNGEQMYEYKNHNLTDVYRLDFDKFDQPGTYYVHIPGIGVSYPVIIAENVWLEAFKISMKGFFNQRSGIELTEEYTDYVKPRSYHPDDGFVVYESTCSLLDSGNGLNALGTDTGNFGNLVAGLTDKVVENAWGGYFDAGDWDRRIQHLEATRQQLELFLMYPDFYKNVDLNIPESANEIPDLLDECMWNIDCYKRMQLPEGGIRGGIEASEHPQKFETSWNDSLTVMAYAPDHWSSYIYAGVTAKLTKALRTAGQEELAEEYLASSQKAFDWAEAEYAVWKDRTDLTDNAKYTCVSERIQAAVDLYAVTGETGYHQIFLENTPMDGSSTFDTVWPYVVDDSTFAYTMLDESMRNEDMYKTCKNAIVSEAVKLMDYQSDNAFNVAAKNIYVRHRYGFYSTPSIKGLARAYYITGGERFLQFMIRGVQFAVGANSINMSFTTGTGYNSPRYPLVVDMINAGLTLPVGITVYGPIDASNGMDEWYIKDRNCVRSTTYPEWTEWPYVDSFLDSYRFPGQNEYTIMQTMGPTSFMWGYLAARK